MDEQKKETPEQKLIRLSDELMKVASDIQRVVNAASKKKD
jgi:hypothetical protein